MAREGELGAAGGAAERSAGEAQRLLSRRRTDVLKRGCAECSCTMSTESRWIRPPGGLQLEKGRFIERLRECRFGVDRIEQMEGKGVEAVVVRILLARTVLSIL